MARGSDRLGDRVVSSEGLGPDGASGNAIERVTLDDGVTLVRKRVSPEWDWISRATGDDGRVLTMWEAGLFDRMPATVDHATVAVERDDDRSWSVYMRDLSHVLADPEAALDRSSLRRVLEGLRALHDAFWGQEIPTLCTLEDRYNLLSPRTARREVARGEGVGSVIERCWDAFVELVPPDVGSVILALAEDPTPLADRLRAFDQTLVHGDVRLTNLGVTADGIALVDWGERTGAAPAAVEYASFLMFDAPRLGAPPDVVLDEIRSVYGDRHDEDALQVAVLGGLVQLGPNPVLDLVLHGGGDARAAATARLSWWIDAAQTALSTWSP